MVTLSSTSAILLKVFNSLSPKEKRIFLSLAAENLDKNPEDKDTTTILLKDSVLMERISADKKGKLDEIRFSISELDAYNKHI